MLGSGFGASGGFAAPRITTANFVARPCGGDQGDTSKARCRVELPCGGKVPSAARVYDCCLRHLQLQFLSFQIYCTTHENSQAELTTLMWLFFLVVQKPSASRGAEKSRTKFLLFRLGLSSEEWRESEGTASGRCYGQEYTPRRDATLATVAAAARG